MEKYVVIFLFTFDKKKVWLIKKEKPDWQKGCLNGIGGKVEEGESPLDAAYRELKEEAGVEKVYDSDLLEVGYMKGINNDNAGFKVWIYTAFTDIELRTMETEEIILKDISDIKSEAHIENVPTLIEACLYKLTRHSNFNKLIMEY